MTIVIKRFDFGRLLKDVCEFLLVDYETAPRQIRDDFMRLLHQPLQRLLKGRIRFTERDDKIGQQLTTRARIDAVLRHQEFGYFGIGIHIQYGVGDRTFIIRRHRKYPEFMRFADDARDADASFQFNIAKYIVTQSLMRKREKCSMPRLHSPATFTIVSTNANAIFSSRAMFHPDRRRITLSLGTRSVTTVCGFMNSTKTRRLYDDDERQRSTRNFW